jgi:hypothetical protein
MSKQRYRFSYVHIDDALRFIFIEDEATVDNSLMSVTNAAEDVVYTIAVEHPNKLNYRYFYLDTEGAVDELCHDGKAFTGFNAGHKGISDSELYGRVSYELPE